MAEAEAEAAWAAEAVPHLAQSRAAEAAEALGVSALEVSVHRTWPGHFSGYLEASWGLAFLAAAVVLGDCHSDHSDHHRAFV